MEMEQENKVVRLEENPMRNEEEVKVDNGSAERDENELSDMDKLPSEILTKILDYLEEQELVKCRLLSSRWNEISCLLLQDKTKKNPKSKLVIELNQPLEENSLKCKTVITKPLEDFVDCFGPSEAEKLCGSARRPFPFAGFKVARFYFMNMAQICEFVSTFGTHMKIFFVEIDSGESNSFEKIWRLLLHFVPNIEHLRIISVDRHCLSYVNLVDPIPITKFSAEKDLRNFKAPNNNKTFENLKVLEIESYISGWFTNFMKNLLDCAPNAQQVSCLDPETLWRRHPLDSLEIFQQVNKTHLVKKLDIGYNSRSELSPAELMKNLRLENLTASFCLPSKYVENEKSCANYIYHALKSSQNTLSSLSLFNFTVENINVCLKDISSLPNVRQLQLGTLGSRDKNVSDRLSQICPNIINLTLGFLRGDFADVAPILWTRFQGLKSLKLTFNMRWERNVLPLDSAFSGYSEESIQGIQSKLEQGISLEEARRGESQNPSILDLKDLSRLQLEFFIGERSDETEKVENQLRNAVFVKILPQHIRENPTSISYFQKLYFARE